MHNMILEIGGLTHEWDGKLGLFGIEDNYMLPFAIQNSYNPRELIDYQSSGMGPVFHNSNNSLKN